MTIQKGLAGLTAIAALTLSACGGGTAGSGDATGAKLLPTEWTSEQRAIDSCLITPGCSPFPTAPFVAYLTGAPANGAAVSGVVRLEVRGYDMANVELLPASGYTPRYGVFKISTDKAAAYLDLDTRLLSNGSRGFRICAYDKPAGQPGAREIVAMSPRTWNISNAPLSTSPFSATLTAAPAANATVRGIVHLEVHGNRIANAELQPGSGSGLPFGTFNVSADRTSATLDFDTRSLSDGARSVRIAVYDRVPGQSGAQQIVAMPARSWNFLNGATIAFTGASTKAPLSGEIVSGTVELEVRGTGIKNAELLPPTGYSPVYGSFYSFSDAGDIAHLEVDTTKLPNGPFNARVSLFSVPAGQSGAKEIIGMPTRQWIIRN